MEDVMDEIMGLVAQTKSELARKIGLEDTATQERVKAARYNPAILNMTCRHQDRGTTEAKTGSLRPILPRSWPKVGEKTGSFVQIQNCWVQP